MNPLVANADGEEFFFDGGDAPFFYDGSDQPFYYDGSDQPFYYDGADEPFYYDGADQPFFYDGSDQAFFYDGFDQPFFYDGSDQPFYYDAADSAALGYTDIEGYIDTITDTYIDEQGVRYYSSDRFAQSYPSQSCFTCQSYSTPRTSFPSIAMPVTSPNYPPSRPPSYPPQQPPRPIAQQQQQQQQQQQHPSNLTTNTCVGNSCNTNVNNIDNSINGSFNSTQLAQATPQYLVQYTYSPVVPPAPIYPQQSLYCVITASPSYVQNGQAAILSWTSYGASSAWLSDGIGAVPSNGSLPVRPNATTNYTLTVNGYGGVRTCSTYVNVSGMAPYVSLSQIPYTGFDLGTFGNAIYWIGLLAFALSGAYLILYYRGGAAKFASSIGLVGSRRIVPVRAERAPVMFSNRQLPATSFQLSGTKMRETRMAREIENLPVARTEVSPKDSMTFASSSNGDAPRIVVSRS
ncbi:hypothetical protein HYW59_04435 [Candidatus Kaiserbacteria bacterium]|nr:hypothetical protein [Candidatus Kaiserbacteria bacterium]